ncbi:MAG: alpha/beta hydrolase fold domain-containing protein [Rhizobiales bacterium]|nr:alpha/beta hydrolase fold domain-containing protein [Hyphomicrobiales bacterium]
MPAMQPSLPRRPIRPTLRQRFEFRAARLLFSLPAAVQVRLSGRPPVVVDGCALHPQMQLLLALHHLWHGGLIAELTPDMARQTFRNDTATIAGRPIPVGAVADIAIDSGGTIAARHYAPAASGPRPLMVYYHGGGFVLGDLDGHDNLCRRVCRDADMHVLSVDYRLAPEHPFPAAVDDACAAFRWACANAARLGATPRVAVGGDSAGGNLAAVVSQKAMTAGGPAPCAQVLLYPALDRTVARPSLELFGKGFFISRADIDWYMLQYTGSTIAQPDPAQNPLCAKEFSGLPPALIVTAGFDPLRDEGEAYADALRQAGVPVVLKRFDGLLHGFCSMATISSACDAALGEIIAKLRKLIADTKNVAPGSRSPIQQRPV